MGTQLTKAKPKTIDDWRKERLKKAKREGGFILIPLELWNSEAFHVLSKSERLILIECLAQLRYAPRSARKRKNLTDQRLFHCGLGYLLNNGEFGLPTKYLQERGIKGEDTIAKAKKRLVQIGFLDVVTQGSFTKAGRFRYSDRWRSFNPDALRTETGELFYEGLLPGYCHYPNIVRFNKKHERSRPEAPATDVALPSGTNSQLDLFTDSSGAA
jgi:hypothetical protein